MARGAGGSKVNVGSRAQPAWTTARCGSAWFGSRAWRGVGRNRIPPRSTGEDSAMGGLTRASQAGRGASLDGAEPDGDFPIPATGCAALILASRSWTYLCRGVGSASRVQPGAPGISGTMALRVGVARSFSRVWKLCAADPRESVSRRIWPPKPRAPPPPAGWRGLARAGARRLGRLGVVLVEEHRLERFAHVPLHVVGVEVSKAQSALRYQSSVLCKIKSNRFHVAKIKQNPPRIIPFAGLLG